MATEGAEEAVRRRTFARSNSEPGNSAAAAVASASAPGSDGRPGYRASSNKGLPTARTVQGSAAGLCAVAIILLNETVMLGEFPTREPATSGFPDASGSAANGSACRRPSGTKTISSAPASRSAIGSTNRTRSSAHGSASLAAVVCKAPDRQPPTPPVDRCTGSPGSLPLRREDPDVGARLGTRYSTMACPLGTWPRSCAKSTRLGAPLKACKRPLARPRSNSSSASSERPWLTAGDQVLDTPARGRRT